MKEKRRENKQIHLLSLLHTLLCFALIFWFGFVVVVLLLLLLLLLLFCYALFHLLSSVIFVG